LVIGKVPSNIPPSQGPKGPKKVAQQKQGGKQGGAKALPGQVKEPALDSRGLAVRLAALAMEAKEKELSMAKIIEKAIEETGIKNPQAAMEEVNNKMQEEIESVLNEIKSNKELMEEAEAWQALGDLLESNLSEEQMHAFVGLVENQIKELN